MFTVALAMSEKQIKCPICGTANDDSAESCKLCKTKLSKKEDGSLKVTSPKSPGQTFNMIDIEDPITRKKLEELTLIPGVTRKKALFLYRSGIHSMEEFLQKAFHGERYSDNYARTVSNKLLMQSLKGKEEKQELLCPSCQAPNPANASKCRVCNFEIEKEMAAIDLGHVSDKLSESVTEIMNELDDDADFDALPDELKAKFASLIDSDDVDYDMEKPDDLESLGIDLDKIGEGAEKIAAKESEDTPDTNSSTEDTMKGAARKENKPDTKPAKEENIENELSEPVDSEKSLPEDETISETQAEKKLSAKEEKIMKVLSGKVDQWRKAGYDTEGLDQYYTDIDTFKIKAKEALEKGKVNQKKFEKQMEMWREKGFDVSELEPLLKSDLDAFQKKAKEVLKKQKSS